MATVVKFNKHINNSFKNAWWC